MNKPVLTATPGQFHTVLLRMMPKHISVMAEGKLVAAVFAKAWEDARYYSNARRFFTDKAYGLLDVYCEHSGLDGSQIRAMYLKHNPHNRDLEEAQ